MIRNYCTIVLLMWLQRGFDALLYSFCFKTKTDFIDLLLHQSTRGSSTVKHHIKVLPPLRSTCVTSSNFIFHRIVLLKSVNLE